MNTLNFVARCKARRTCEIRFQPACSQEESSGWEPTIQQNKGIHLFCRKEEDKKLLGQAGFGREEDLSRFVLIRIALGLLGLTIRLFLNWDAGFGPFP